MFKNAKIIITLILTLTLLTSMLVQPMYAAQISETNVQPRWQNAATMVLTVNFDNPKIYLSVAVTGYSGTTYRNGVAVLEKISGSNCGTIKTWSGITSNTAVLSFKDSSISKTKGTYRLTFTVTTVRNGVSETISTHKDATY